MFTLQDPKILDSSSQSDDIIQYLGALLEKMESLNNLAFTFKSYQKNFKVLVLIKIFCCEHIIMLIIMCNEVTCGNKITLISECLNKVFSFSC